MKLRAGCWSAAGDAVGVGDAGGVGGVGGAGGASGVALAMQHVVSNSTAQRRLPILMHVVVRSQLQQQKQRVHKGFCIFK